MTIYLYQSFLQDLHAHGDSGFPQRVLRKLLNPNGTFRNDGEDHRHDGVDDGWIRYVSAGRSAYRAIYIRRGEDIYLYRAGEHSIEDRLRGPRPGQALAELRLDADGEGEAPEPENLFRQNGRNRRLNAFLLGRRLAPHREIILVSPFLTLDLLERTTRLGLVLDQLREDGSKVTLITRWPLVEELSFFHELEVRGWELLFHKTLHAKLYIFSIDSGRARHDSGIADAALIGSANLTNSGFELGDREFNEEFCYELPSHEHAGAMDFVAQLAFQSEDLSRVRHNLIRKESVMVLTPEEFYKDARLEGNPFRPNPVQGTDPRISIWVGYETQRRQLIKYLARSRADQVGNVNFIMLYGDYGTGKSHALLWALNEITKEQKQEFNSLAFYIPTLKKEKGQLTFAGAYREDIVNRTNLIAETLHFRAFLRNASIQVAAERGLAGHTDEREIITSLIESVDLRTFALRVLECDTEAKVRAAIGAEKASDYEAMLTFTRLVNLFTLEIPLAAGAKRFKNAVYLMIDEVDDLQRASSKDARDINDILRHIYDGCPACFGLVIGLSAEVADLAAIFYPYLLERLSRRLHFDTMDRVTTVDFVLSILKESRTGGPSVESAFPFEVDAVEAVASSLSKITPRKIINVMQQVLEEVRLAGLDPKRGLADLAFLDEHAILDEVLGDGGLG